MVLFLLVINCMIVLTFWYGYKDAGKIQEHRVLDVTFTEEQMEDKDIWKIVDKYKKVQNQILWIGIISQFGLHFCQKYMSVFFTLYLLWMAGFTAAEMGWFVCQHRKLYQLKLEKGYCFENQKSVIRIDTRVSAQSDKMTVSEWWFVPVFLFGALILNVP